MESVGSGMRRAWAMAKGNLAALALVAALGAALAVPAAAQDEGRPAAEGPSRKVIRTKRLRVPADLFERDAVFFKRVRVEVGGTIRADGHNLDLYGMELVLIVPPERKWLRVIIDGDDEAEAKERALAEHIAAHPEDAGLTVRDFNWAIMMIVNPPVLAP